MLKCWGDQKWYWDAGLIFYNLGMPPTVWIGKKIWNEYEKNFFFKGYQQKH